MFILSSRGISDSLYQLRGFARELRGAEIEKQLGQLAVRERTAEVFLMEARAFAAWCDLAEQAGLLDTPEGQDEMRRRLLGEEAPVSRPKRRRLGRGHSED